MKLSELKPCEVCGGPVAPFIHVVTVTRHFIKPQETNQALGITQMLGGSLELAEVMGATGDVTEEFDTHTGMLCGDCAMPTLALVMRDEDWT